jgi:putative flippase GtrA
MRNLIRSRGFREIARYAAATGAAFVIDFGLLAALVSLLGVPYLAAAAISFVAGNVFLYWAATRHIFEFRRVDDARKEFAIFVVIGVVGLAVNLLVIWICVELLDLHYLVGKIGSGGVTFFANYALRRLLLFTPWRGPTAAAHADERAS